MLIIPFVMQTKNYVDILCVGKMFKTICYEDFLLYRQTETQTNCYLDELLHRRKVFRRGKNFQTKCYKGQNVCRLADTDPFFVLLSPKREWGEGKQLEDLRYPYTPISYWGEKYEKKKKNEKFILFLFFSYFSPSKESGEKGKEDLIPTFTYFSR